MEKSRVMWYEPVFFLFFGAMHTSRVWAFIDRQAYADAWLGLMYGKGPAYYLLMAVMALLCVVGIVTFLACRGRGNYWWRWVYIFGGGYILFDLFAIAVGLRFWERLLLMMFDPAGPFWTLIWGSFVLIGALCLALGVRLCGKIKRKKGYR